MLNRFGRIGMFVAVSAAMVSPAHAGDVYRVSGAEVVVVCPLTVGGSFEARTKTVRGEVAASIRRAP
jgi:hypothetical protein